MRHAIFEAIDIWRNRNNYDEPMGNPLQKLYHEKRDDSEKVRFSIPRSRREDKEDREAFNINEEAE
jgi:4-hydroxythreonine-4-phosphate dehydrogenase